MHLVDFAVSSEKFVITYRKKFSSEIGVFRRWFCAGHDNWIN